MSVYAFIVVLVCMSCVSAQQCRPATGGLGRCMVILDCEPLLALVTKKDKTQQDIDILRKSQCGFQDSTPTVCCPDPCYTADGKPGKCIDVFQCPHIMDMLKPPVSKENTQFVQNSKCNGASQYSVCCGPPPSKVMVGDCQNQLTAFPPDPRTRCCGYDNIVGNKIYGGTATLVDEFPWLVIIEYSKQGQIKLLCGGSLISSKYVLTAGHCVAGAVLDAGTPTNVRLGEYDTTNDGPDCAKDKTGALDCSEGAVIIPIEETIPHPDYSPSHPLKRNDIALIRLKQAAPYTEFIRPICLPTVDITLQSPVVNLTAAGWGAVSNSQPKSNIKLQVSLPLVDPQTCQQPYTVPGRNVALWKGQVCAGGEPGKDSCKGDSGGPLMYENGKTYEIVGIVSFGPKPCGLEGIPGVYTRVYEYNNWIRSTIRP